MLSYTDLFDYFKSERSMIIEALEKLPVEELTKNRELSYYSLKDVFLHSVAGEDVTLHYRMQGLSPPEFHFTDYPDMAAVKRYVADVDRKTSELFSRITEGELKREVRFKRRDGTETVYTVEDALYNTPIEVIHHYGEIFAEFWKMNLNAPFLSYMAWVREKKAAPTH